MRLKISICYNINRWMRVGDSNGLFSSEHFGGCVRRYLLVWLSSYLDAGECFILFLLS
jgi:hypothetical protein